MSTSEHVLYIVEQKVVYFVRVIGTHSKKHRLEVISFIPDQLSARDEHTPGILVPVGSTVYHELDCK